jgi:tetratricopeptide (TPR) repeat protein
MVSSMVGGDHFSLESWLRGEDSDPLAFLSDDAASPKFAPSFHLPRKDTLLPEQIVTLQDLESRLTTRKAQLNKEIAQVRAHLVWITRMGYPENKGSAEKISSDRRIAQVLAEHGDKETAIRLYQDILKRPLHSAETDKTKRTQEIFTRTEIAHELAALHLQTGNYNGAAELLDKKLTELTALDVSGAKLTKDGKNNWLVAKETLQIQNRFLKAEALLAKAHKPEDLQEGINLLEELNAKPPVDFFHLDKGDPQEALLGRVKLRLAQVLLGQDPTSSRGKHLLQRITKEFSENTPDHLYLRSEAEFAYGLAVLQSPGTTLEGLRLLRAVQTQYPGTQADQSIRRSSTLAKLRGSDGVIRQNINEGDIGEMLKVLLDRSDDGPGWRKGLFAGAGALVAILFWEVSIPVIAIGAGTGYFAEKGVSAVEKRHDILDAYQTGLSNVDSSRHMQNLFMLGVDVAMLVVAGAGGAIARQGVRVGVGWAANRTAGYMARTGIGVASAQRTLAWMAASETRTAVAAYLGTRLLPAAADATAASLIYAGERSLFLGEEFKWSPKDALLMYALCESFALARWMGTGAKFAAKPVFNQGLSAVLRKGELVGFKDATGKMLSPVLKEGKLAHYADAAGRKYSPITQHGKVVGLTNTAGQLVVFASDLLVGATMYYSLLLGPLHSLHQGAIPDYDAFLAEQIKTLGALHLGGKVAHRTALGGLDRALAKLDKKSTALLKEAKETLEKAEPRDPGGPFPFGPFGPFGWEFAPVGGYGPAATRRHWNRPDPKTSGIMTMENNGDGKPWNELWPLEEALLEKDIANIKHRSPQAGQQGEVRVYLEKDKGELNTVADALLGSALPPQLGKVRVILAEEPNVAELAKLVHLSKQKAISIEVGREGAAGSSEFKPSAVIVAGKVQLNLADPAAVPDLLNQAVKASAELSVVDAEGAVWAKLEKKTGAAAAWKLSLNVPKRSATVTAEKIASWTKSFSKLESQVLKGTDVEIHGIEFDRYLHTQDDLRPFLEKAMWEGCRSFSAGNKRELFLKALGSGKRYQFQTKLSFDHANLLFAEYLTHEAAVELGSSGPAHPQTAVLRKFFRGALFHAKSVFQSHSVLGKGTEEYAPYVTGSWTECWKKGLDQMLSHSSRHQAQVLDVLDRVEKYSQKEEGKFLEFRAFNVIAFSDNAFELMRIFEKATEHPAAYRDVGLSKILGTLQDVMGAGPNVEVYGAVVGVVYKVSYGDRDFAALHEGEGLTDVLAAIRPDVRGRQKWPGRYRIWVIPEDPFFGRESATRTKTPDWILETLSSAETTERRLTVELTNADGSRTSPGEIQSTLQKKIEQIQTHRFFPNPEQTDGLIIYKFYNAASRGPQLVEDVRKALQTLNPGHPERIKVMLILEKGVNVETSVWLEYSGGKWQLRSDAAGRTTATGRLWPEAPAAALGWE